MKNHENSVTVKLLPFKGFFFLLRRTKSVFRMCCMFKRYAYTGEQISRRKRKYSNLKHASRMLRLWFGPVANRKTRRDFPTGYFKNKKELLVKAAAADMKSRPNTTFTLFLILLRFWVINYNFLRLLTLQKIKIIILSLLYK